MKDFKRVLLGKYKRLIPKMKNCDFISLKDFRAEQFQSTVIAAFVKCFEFNLDINKAGSKASAFYLTAFLRGICEDLISLKYISALKKTERDEIIIAYNQYLLLSSVESQMIFFKSMKPFQPIVSHPDNPKRLEYATQLLKDLWIMKGHKKGKIFPSVEHMAIDSKLKKLYDYLYHATSKTVHFSPNILLRTGWYKSKNYPIVFSCKNFSGYYDIFNSFYASYLFIEFCSAFKKQMNLDDSFLKVVQDINGTLKDFDYFPELVTFEELNIKRPNNLPYKIMELTSKMGKDEKESFMKHLPEILKEAKKIANNSKKG